MLTCGVEYDAAGRATALIDGNGNRTTQGYNARGELVRKTDALGRTESFGYDALGRQTSHTNARGRTTTSSYDALGRLTRQVLPDGTQVVQSYDALGQLLSVQNALGTTTSAYDAAGRLTSTTDALGQTLFYAYDALGRRTAMTRGDGGRTSYTYDAASRLIRLDSPGGEITRYEYDAAGRQTKQVLPNSLITVQHVYDGAGREVRKEERSAAGALLLSWAFQYDAAGNKTQVSELNGSVTTYGYDATSQLTGEARTGPNAYSLSYLYDAVGNRLTKTRNGAATTSAYNALNQLVRQQAPDGAVTSFVYDQDGNLSQQSWEDGSGTSYGFDDLDQLRVLEVRGAGGALQSRREFGYDALSRLLVSKATANGATSEKRRVFDGLDVVQERDGVNGWLANVARDGNIGGIVGRGTAGGDLCFHYDGQGNVVALSDESGAIVGRYVYDAFGNLLTSSGVRAEENPYRFSTKESIAGLVYFGYRFYSPELGRWISRDPIGEAGGINLYGMVDNNPVNFVDDYGLTKRSCNEIASDIFARVGEIAWRIEEMRIDRRHLYDFRNAPGGINPAFPNSGTWQTHIDELRRQRINLRRLIKEWEDGPCGQGGNPPPAHAWKWFAAPTPKHPRRYDYRFLAPATPLTASERFLLQIPGSYESTLTAAAVAGGVAVVAAGAAGFLASGGSGGTGASRGTQALIKGLQIATR